MKKVRMILITVGLVCIVPLILKISGMLSWSWGAALLPAIIILISIASTLIVAFLAAGGIFMLIFLLAFVKGINKERQESTRNDRSDLN